jgi:hypothetical protein
MSTNTITSFSGLWKPTEYRNIGADHVSMGTTQARRLSVARAAVFGQKLFFDPRSIAKGGVSCAAGQLPDYYGRPTETQKGLGDEFYHLDPYSGGGSGSIHAGQAATLGEVLHHYNTAPKTPMASLEQERQ